MNRLKKRVPRLWRDGDCDSDKFRVYCLKFKDGDRDFDFNFDNNYLASGSNVPCPPASSGTGSCLPRFTCACPAFGEPASPLARRKNAVESVSWAQVLADKAI